MVRVNHGCIELLFYTRTFEFSSIFHIRATSCAYHTQCVLCTAMYSMVFLSLALYRFQNKQSQNRRNEFLLLNLSNGTMNGGKFQIYPISGHAIVDVFVKIQCMFSSQIAISLCYSIECSQF